MSKASAVPSGVTGATLAKDLRLEWRSKDAINSMLFFALLVVVVFSFSFDPNAEESRHIAGGLTWVAFLFAAVRALNQTWARRVGNRVPAASPASPAPPRAPGPQARLCLGGPGPGRLGQGTADCFRPPGGRKCLRRAQGSRAACGNRH